MSGFRTPVQWLAVAAIALTTAACAPGLAAGAATPAVPRFDHIFVVVGEDAGYAQVTDPQAAPHLVQLASTGAVATNYHALVHPGYADYMALTAGDLLGTPSHCTPISCSTNAVNLTDRLDAAGLSWRAYMDGMPAPCTLTNVGTYEAQHDIFLYYDDIRLRPQRCDSHVVPLTQLGGDLKSSASAPNFIWIEPTGCDGMQDCAPNCQEICAVKRGDAWIAAALDSVFSSPAWQHSNSVLFLTWDEDDFTPLNQVATFAFGPQVKAGARTSRPYDQYSLLKTIEVSWGLRPLTPHDSTAQPMSDLFQER